MGVVAVERRHAMADPGKVTGRKRSVDKTFACKVLVCVDIPVECLGWRGGAKGEEAGHGRRTTT